MYLVQPLWNRQLHIPHKNNQDTVQVYVQKNLRMTNTISLQWLANFVDLPISDGPCYHNPAPIHQPLEFPAQPQLIPWPQGLPRKLKFLPFYQEIQENPKM